MKLAWSWELRRPRLAVSPRPEVVLSLRPSDRGVCMYVACPLPMVLAADYYCRSCCWTSVNSLAASLLSALVSNMRGLPGDGGEKTFLPALLLTYRAHISFHLSACF